MSTSQRSLELPSDADVQRTLGDAQRLFHRVLANWASDALEVRRLHRDELAWTDHRPAKAA